MQLTPQVKTFFLGLSVSLLILVSFFAGALADRVFVVKPLDFIAGQRPAQSRTQTQQSPLGSLLQGNEPLQAISSVADVAEDTAQSVVTVSISKQQRVFEPNQTDPFGFGIFGFGGTERIEQIQRDIGTGFVVDGGFVITNRHVVSDPDASFTVIDRNEQEYQVSNIYRDPSNDLAILQIEGNNLPVLPLGDSDQIRVGESVIAIGTALGEFRHTVTTGVISGLGRGIEATDGYGFESLDGVIQTDAAINPGNSGGPLLNANGQVIGVNVAVSAVGQNIGFAIPINVVKASLDNFNQTGQFDRPFLGVSFRMISEQAALFNDVPQGAYILEVVQGTVAADAGLQPGDIVTEFAGEAVTEDTNLAALINEQTIGDRVGIVYWRDGQRQVTEVTLRGQN